MESYQPTPGVEEARPCHSAEQKPTRAPFLPRRTLCECDCTVQHLNPERQFPVIAYTALHCCTLDQPSLLAAPARDPHAAAAAPSQPSVNCGAPDNSLFVYALYPAPSDALYATRPRRLTLPCTISSHPVQKFCPGQDRDRPELEHSSIHFHRSSRQSIRP